MNAPDVALLREAHHPLGVLGLGDVGGERARVASRVADLLRRRLGGLFLQIDGHDLRAFARVEDGGRAAVADPFGLRRGAGDDRDLAFESHDQKAKRYMPPSTGMIAPFR